MKLSFESIFGLVIGIILAFIIGSVIWAVVQSQLSGDLDDATLSAFDEIASTVKSLDVGETRQLFVDINKPFVIVGFDKGEQVRSYYSYRFYPTREWNFELKNLQSPCKKACLCICPAKWEQGKYQLNEKDCFTYKDKCKEFDDIDNFYYPFEGEKGVELGYSVPFVFKKQPYEITITRNEASITAQPAGLEIAVKLG